MSLGHGSNTITMVLLGPQGTAQHLIWASNEHALHTKIMEESLALFFCYYQSVVHLTEPTRPWLSSAPVSLFFCPFLPLSVHPCPLVDPTHCFLTLCLLSVLWDRSTVGVIRQSSILSTLFFPLLFALNMSLFSLLSSKSWQSKTGSLVAAVGLEIKDAEY